MNLHTLTTLAGKGHILTLTLSLVLTIFNATSPLKTMDRKSKIFLGSQKIFLSMDSMLPINNLADQMLLKTCRLRLTTATPVTRLQIHPKV
jgi:hypothetical protein